MNRKYTNNMNAKETNASMLLFCNCSCRSKGGLQRIKVGLKRRIHDGNRNHVKQIIFEEFAKMP